MNYDIRYNIGDLVNLVDDPWGRNPWRVVSIFILGDDGIIDEKQQVMYNLASHGGDAGCGAYNHEISPTESKKHKFYVTDPSIVAMVKDMTLEERDNLARDFERLLGWERGDGPGVRFDIVEDE